MIKNSFTNRHKEPHGQKTGAKLNWLRASVLGANDGIVSTAALIFGVAGAEVTRGYIITAGIAGLVAGALSMGLGEYISVSAQRDTEKALIEKEKKELKEQPDFELEELTQIYQKKGISRETALQASKELMQHDALAAHLEAELGIDQTDLANPWVAAFSSAAAFTAGAIIPILMVVFSTQKAQIYVTFAGVVLALILTGTLSAYAGGASKAKATFRVVLGGILAMAVTYGIGKLFGVVGL